MRYFLTTNASRPITAGGHSFSFEPVSLRGGTWLGILAVEDDSLATSILNVRPAGVDEITAERYDSLKKKLTANSPSSPAWPEAPRSNHAVAVVEPAANRIGQTTVSPQQAAAVTESITLATTSNQPPDEPLLAQTAKKKGRPW